MNKKIIISIPLYKEAENIKKMVEEIFNYCPYIEILIINDESKDETSEIIKKLDNNKIILIERPEKLGLGTAHKLSILYAIKNNYNYLITMDGDFSHDPKYLPEFIKNITSNKFIIGSRFHKEGKSDYKGIRKYVSKGGNYVAQKILNINLKEFTTYFRVYEVESLKKLPFDELNSQGYSLGVRIIWLLNKMKIDLLELPIHFKDRNKGKSKIPKLQIFVSALDLIIMKLKDIFSSQKFYAEDNITYNFNLECTKCKNNIFSLIKKNIFKCLVCGKNKIKSN